MSDFADHVDAWTDFFMLAGTAAATLTGLLFVAVSLREDIRALPAESFLRTTARRSFQSYLSVLLFAFYFLIPEPTPETIAWPVILTAAVTLQALVRSGLRLGRDPDATRDLFAWQIVVPSLCYVATIAVGVGLFWREEDQLYLFVAVTAFLLIIPTRNAWHLLTSREDALRTAAEPRRER